MKSPAERSKSVKKTYLKTNSQKFLKFYKTYEPRNSRISLNFKQKKHKEFDTETS